MYAWLMGSFRNCPEGLDSDVSQTLCKDVNRNTHALACSTVVSYRISRQLVVDIWLGIQGESLGSCGIL